MATLIWDVAGERMYETGVNHGVLYVYDTTKSAYGDGVAWNGLTAVTESPSGAESNPQYADNIKYLDLISTEEFGATIEAFMYPDAFMECNGEAEITTGASIGQQTRKMFGFSYRTVLGNDVDNNDHGYKLHLIYGCRAAASEKAYATVSDSPEAITFSWEISTTPVSVSGHKSTASLTVDSTKVSAEGLKALEDVLYGTAEQQPRLPLPDEVKELLATSPKS